MFVRILPLRRQGRRLSHHDWINQPAVEGALSLSGLGTRRGFVRIATLQQVGGGLTHPLLPELYEPTLTTLGNGVLVLRGFERCATRAGSVAVVQEWHCTVVKV